MHLGIEAGLATPALAERIGLQSADHTQQQVLDWLDRDHGIKWSAESLRKLSASLSGGLSAFRQPAQEKKILELLKKAEKSTGPHRPVLAVGRDGIMVPMRHGAYQEASTATVYVMDRRGKRLGTVYLGQMPESGQGTLSDQLTSLLTGVLTKWDGCPLRYVYVTDAGHHPQEYYKTVLKTMEDPRRPGHLFEWQWIVDFWHACCYLTKLRGGVVWGIARGMEVVQTHAALVASPQARRHRSAPVGHTALEPRERTGRCARQTVLGGIRLLASMLDEWPIRITAAKASRSAAA